MFCDKVLVVSIFYARRHPTDNTINLNGNSIGTIYKTGTSGLGVINYFIENTPIPLSPLAGGVVTGLQSSLGVFTVQRFASNFYSLGSNVINIGYDSYVGNPRGVTISLYDLNSNGNLENQIILYNSQKDNNFGSSAYVNVAPFTITCDATTITDNPIGSTTNNPYGTPGPCIPCYPDPGPIPPTPIIIPLTTKCASENLVITTTMPPDVNILSDEPILLLTSTTITTETSTTKLPTTQSDKLITLPDCNDGNWNGKLNF
jgi:hypothetical protein